MPQTNTTRRALPLHAGGRGKGGINMPIIATIKLPSLIYQNNRQQSF